MAGIRGLALVVLSILIVPIFISNSSAVDNAVNDVKVLDNGNSLRVEIDKIGDVEFTLFKMTDPERLVINCIGAKYLVPWQEKDLNSTLAYRVRTSQFENDPLKVTRVVLDLKKDVSYRFDKSGDRPTLLVFEKSDGSGAENAVNEEGSGSRSSNSAKTTGASNLAAMGPVLPLVKPAAKHENSTKKSSVESGVIDAVSSGENEKTSKVTRVEDKYSNTPWIVETNSGNEVPKKTQTLQSNAYENDVVSPGEIEDANEGIPWTDTYTGGTPAAGEGVGIAPKRITLDAQGADIKTVLRTISDFAGKNIVYGPDVKGEVYVHIKDVQWEEALDIILKAHGYAYREEYGMIRVAEASRLMKEELAAQTAERKKEDLLPLVTKIIFVNNSNADELKDALQNIVSTRGKIDVDKGSNALIVNDIEQNIEKIEDMVKALDRKTYQVDINAKLAEVDVEATRELGINWGLLNLHAAGFNGVGSADVNSVISLKAASLKFGTVRSWGEITAILDMLEQSNKANIISNPRITTMDNREASILVGKEIPLIVADEAGNPITELTKIGIMLKVIPHVNADKTITLDLHPEVSELQSESTAQGGVIISTSEADTRVIVRNGETAVIGGLIKKVKTDLKRGVPFLMDVPIIGGIFSSTSSTDKKQELVIFVTPTIVE